MKNLRHNGYTYGLLAVILLIGAGLRFTGLNWDEGQWIHPDEGHMRIITAAIRMPDHLGVYFDTQHSPLNPRNNGQRYSYGTLPLFLTRATAAWLDDGCAGGDSPSDRLARAVAALIVGKADVCGSGSFAGGYSALVGRMFSVLADLGTVLVVYLLGRRLGRGEDGSGNGNENENEGAGADEHRSEMVGLLAAGLAALTPFMIQQAHFFTVDSMACFFITLTAYFAVRAGQTGRWSDFGWAGLTTGLATACKIDGVFAGLLVVLAGLLRILRRERIAPATVSAADWTGIGARWVLAGLLAFIAFRVTQPYAFEGPGFLGMRISAEWFDRLLEIVHEQSGEVDFPWGRQWTNRTPIVFPWVNMVVWGMGIPLGLAAWAGWAASGVELWRGRYRYLVPWGWVTLEFLYQGTRWVKAMRYNLPLYPLLIVFAAIGLVRLGRAVARAGRSPRGRWEWGRWWGWWGWGLAALVCIGTTLWSLAFISIYRRPHTRVAASRWIYEHVPPGSTVANEHYDWGLPLRVDGHDPFGGMYRGIEMQLYNEDTMEKRTQLYNWLDQADYIFLASNRLYASIPRLPARYPLTIEYYRALFAGELGFELVADFTSAPALGPFQFPDQENPFPLMPATEYTYQQQPIRVPLPPAEEAFSVYDHPRVLIFRKTAAYSPELVARRLDGVNILRAFQGQTPLQAEKAPDLLRFDPRTWADQQAGGTWSEMFDRQSLTNRYPALAVVVWWLAVTVLGWLAFPLLFVSLPRLPERGYGLSRVAGLLFVAYLTWLMASLHILPNTRTTIVRMTLLLALVGGGVGWSRWSEIRCFLHRRRRLIWLIEALFAALYLAWVGVRWLQPDLWHPVVGGEKPMDFAYLNAVMKSTWFPPYNPWLAGHIINYYYFGFVIVGTLIKLLGTFPALAYNLAVPLLFALTGVGAFSVAYNLFGGHYRGLGRQPGRGALVAGLCAMALTVLLGNLGVVKLIRAALISLAGGAFPSTVPWFADTVAMFRGLWEIIAHGAKLPIRTESWYWNPTRIIPTQPGEVGPITEFPAFTFLYGDLHAHMIALPLTLLALTLTVYWVRHRRPHWGSFLLAGIGIGALRPTNTWDYPTYLTLALAGLFIGAIATGRKPQRGWFRGWIVRAAVLVGLTVVCYLPYIQNYAVGYSSVEMWHGSRTPTRIYLWIHGIFLFPLLTRMGIELFRRWRRHAPDGLADGHRLVLVLISVGGGVIAVGLALVGYPVALITVPVGMAALGLLLAPAPTMPANRRWLWFMVGSAMALSLAVEGIVLKGDIGRMNTVFKFYLQVWVLLAVAAGVSVGWWDAWFRVWRSGQSEWRTLWWTGMAILAMGGALFLPYGIRARAIDRMSPETGRTLDGMAFMQTAVVSDGPSDAEMRTIPLAGDYAAIRWLQENISGSPVILEAVGRREYLWSSRVSIYTGLPTVVGWRWHQVQQYAMLPSLIVDWRREDVRECYNSTDIAQAQAILDRYDVRYIYVGEYERAYYTPAGLAKFDEMVTQGLLRLVYDAQGVRIYQVMSSAAGDGG